MSKPDFIENGSRECPAKQDGHVPCIIRSAKDLKEVETFWWPHMQSLGWNRALADGSTHLTSASKEAWLHALRSATAAPEGMLAATVFANSTGWVTFFIVSAALRGKGLGAHLFAAAMDYFAYRGTRYIGLDAVAEQVPTYGRRGFVEAGRLKLFTREHTRDIPDAQEGLRDGEEVVPLRAVGAEVLLASDLAHTGLERRRLWLESDLLSRRDTIGFVVRSTAPGEATQPLKGWILVRECEHGFRVGPLYANSKEVASLLLYTAMKNLEGRQGSFVVEMWPANKEATGVFEHFGWKDSGAEYHRMWFEGRVPRAQEKGGKAETEMFAIFDASEG